MIRPDALDAQSSIPSPLLIPRRPIVAGLGALVGQMLFPKLVSAQFLPDNGQYGPNERMLSQVYPRFPTDSLFSMPHSGKIEDLGSGIVRVSFNSPFSDRDHFFIGVRNGQILYKRTIYFNSIFAGKVGNDIDQGNIRAYKGWVVETIIDPPKYHRYQPADLFETQVNTYRGMAAYAARIKSIEDRASGTAYVVRKDTGKIMERWDFLWDYPAAAPLDEIASVMNEGIYPVKPPAPEPAPSIPKKVCLIPVDGNGSTNLTVLKNFDPVIKAMNPAPDLIAHFGPNGWDVLKDKKDPDKLPTFILKPFSSDDSRRDLLKHPSQIKTLVDEVMQYVDQVKFVGFSQGSFDIFQYLVSELLRKDSAHRGVVTHAYLMAGPLAGIDHQITPFWFGIFGENAVSNENSELFAAMASTPEKRILRAADNRTNAERLWKEAGVRIETRGSKWDCIVSEKSSVIDGYGRALDLPRALPSCELSLVKAALLGDNPAEAAGHLQILTASAEDGGAFLSS
jgi:hypothetical protein